MNQYVKQYQKTHIETASPETILILLFDGAIQFLNKAKVAMKEKDIEGMHNGLIGAQNIITEFINTIDREPSPEVADNLVRLYNYMLDRLIEANIKRDEAPVDEVLEFLRTLKGTWERAIQIAQNERAAKKSAVQANTKDYEDDEEGEE